MAVAAAETPAPNGVDEKLPKRHRRDNTGGPVREQQSLKECVASNPDKSELKVSATTDTRRFAGALAHVAREHRDVKISALSPANVNTAIKAVAVARDYVKEEGIDVGVVVHFRDQARRALELRYVTFDSRFNVPAEGSTVYTVGKSTNSAATAGAVAARVREDTRPVLSCIGAGALIRALTSVGIANEYIERETHHKNELLVIPYFTNESKGADTITVLNMCVVKIDV